jgi:hypothetical protein
VVERLFRQSAVRLPVVLVAAFGWLTLSNHCALAAMHGTSKPPMSCHGGTATKHAPGKQRDPVECCKVVRATLLTPAKSVAALDQLSFAVVHYVTAIVIQPDDAAQNRIFEWDTGPPGRHWFAEIVLQRSILAHAPPSPA